MIFIHQRSGETANSTAGHILGPDGAVLSQILERGARNADHPRIPAGEYKIAHKPVGSSEFDKAFGALLGPAYKGVLWLPGVPGRTNIEVHTANYIEQLLGCLATGMSLSRDVNGDFMIPGGQSSPAYKRLYLAVSPQIDLGSAVLSVRDIASAALVV